MTRKLSLVFPRRSLSGKRKNPSPREMDVNGEETIDDILEEAVNQTGFGKSNFKTCLICVLINLFTSVNLFALWFVLPIAMCDYEMTTLDQSYLNTSMMLGMLTGSYIWGCLGQSKGRKYALCACMLILGLADFVASFIPFYWAFFVLKTISGLAASGTLTVVFPYVGEFQPTKYRNRSLFLLEVAWVLGQFFTPLMAWGIVNLNIEIRPFGSTLRAWNLFLLACSIPSIVIALCLTAFPETPAYHASVGEFREMLEILSTMYEENTQGPRTMYIEKLRNSENTALSSLIERLTGPPDYEKGKNRKRKNAFSTIMRRICRETAHLMCRPYVGRTLLISLMSFFVGTCYFTITMWLPDLFDKFQVYEMEYPNKKVDIYGIMRDASNNLTLVAEPATINCAIEKSTYIHNISVGALCLASSMMFLILVHRVGYRLILCVNSLICCLTMVALIFTRTPAQVLILSCIYEACVAPNISILYSLVVQVYPANLRSAAIGLCSFHIRLGTIVGNLSVGYAIDHYCFYLIVAIATELFLTGLFSNFIPREMFPMATAKTRNEESRDNNNPVRMEVMVPNDAPKSPT